MEIDWKEINVAIYVRQECEGREIDDERVHRRAVEILDLDEVFMTTVPDEDQGTDYEWMTDENIEAVHTAIEQALGERGLD